MKIAGIICEYNPFHNGHQYLIDKARNSGYAVVCVMSGNYTQRGELAISHKLDRAETAVKCGADLVLELPFPYAMSSAEFFASGGVSVLEEIGAETIYFGSESGDIDLIKKAALAAASDEMKIIKEESERNEGSAKSYFKALGRVLGEDVELLSNDILAIEYQKEIVRRGLYISINAVKRVGDRYLDEVAVSDYASATAIRKILMEKDNEKAQKYMPKTSFEIFIRGANEKTAPVDIRNAESAILAFWRMAEPAELSRIAELGNGLEYRIKEAALSSASLDELEDKTATKKYTAAKIRRAVIFAFLGVTKDMLDREAQYTAVLASNATGREILSSLRKRSGKLCVVTKNADAPDGWQRELNARADSLYTLAMAEPREAGYFAKRKIYIE